MVMKRKVIATMLGAATLLGTGATLTSCSKDDISQEQKQDNNLSYTITDSQSLGATLDKIAADLNRIAAPYYNKGEKVDVDLNIKINPGALKFVYSEDLIKFAALLEGNSGVLIVDEETRAARIIIDFYGIKNLNLSISGDKNVTVCPDVMKQNGYHVIPDYDYNKAYSRSLYLLGRHGFNVSETPGLEIAGIDIKKSTGKTLKVTPEMLIKMDKGRV